MAFEASYGGEVLFVFGLEVIPDRLSRIWIVAQFSAFPDMVDSDIVDNV